MTEEKKLQLVFITDLGKTKTITVAGPRENVTKSEAEAAMQILITHDIFNSPTGHLKAINEARIRTIQTQVLA